MASEPKDPCCKVDDVYNFESQPIEVQVGAAKRKFYVHESVIARSPFFEKAMRGEWKESKKRVVTLPEDEPEVFAAYLHWVYTGRIPCPPLTLLADYCYPRLAELCGLAEKLLDDEFMDSVLDSIVIWSRKSIDGNGRVFPGARPVKIIYDKTPEGSTARKLMVDMYVSHADKNFTITDAYGTEFLIDLTKDLLTVRPDLPEDDRKEKYAQLDSGSPCRYHKHAKDKPCTGKSK